MAKRMCLHDQWCDTHRVFGVHENWRKASPGGSNRMLSAAETAQMLGIPPGTLYRYWRKWGIRAYRVGRALKFRERDIETWIERSEA